MRWMLDTDTCIAMIKRRPDGILRRLSGKSIGQVGMSSITLAELSYGTVRSSRPTESQAALRDFLLALEVAAFDEAAARQYGTVRADLAQRGAPIGPLDTLIAVHALALDAVLVSHNVREFKRVRDLRCEDWL